MVFAILKKKLGIIEQQLGVFFFVVKGVGGTFVGFLVEGAGLLYALLYWHSHVGHDHGGLLKQFIDGLVQVLSPLLQALVIQVFIVHLVALPFGLVEDFVCLGHVARLKCLGGTTHAVGYLVALGLGYAYGRVEQEGLLIGQRLLQGILLVQQFLQFVAVSVHFRMVVRQLAGIGNFVRQFLQSLAHALVVLVARGKREVVHAGDGNIAPVDDAVLHLEVFQPFVFHLQQVHDKLQLQGVATLVVGPI